MKKSLLLFSLVATIFAACKKDGQDTPAVVPEISITNITYPNFNNSTWKHLLGGIIVIDYKLKNKQDSTISDIKDNLDLSNLSSYKKEITKGIYDISIVPKLPNVAADTFLRFSAQVKSLDVQNKQALSFTATTNDGLITIGQSYIADKTVPVFKSDTGTNSYRFGLSNGFYYLYVKSGIKGHISFTSKLTSQTVNKSFSIASSTHLNLAVVANKLNGAEVVFEPFAYNQVSAVSTTLATFKVNPGFFINGETYYFVATDEEGKIIAEAKYLTGTANFKLVTTEPFTKDRFNLYQIETNRSNGSVPEIKGFLQVKKGSTFTGPQGVSYPVPPYKINLNYQNATAFDMLSINIPGSSLILRSPNDVSANGAFTVAGKAKAIVEVQKDNQIKYNVFDIEDNTKDFTVDLNLCTKLTASTNLTTTGTGLNISLYARPSKTSQLQYYLGYFSENSDHLTYYYPQETFEDYTSYVGYTKDNFYYRITTVGSSFTKQADAYNASFSTTGTSMADYAIKSNGETDFYSAVFFDNTAGQYLHMSLLSPTTANYTQPKFPDFSKYLNFTYDPKKMLYQGSALFKVDGFDETNIYYENYFDLLHNVKSVSSIGYQ